MADDDPIFAFRHGAPDPKPALTDEQCQQIDRAYLEFKLGDGYFKRACETALWEQIRRQNMTGEWV